MADPAGADGRSGAPAVLIRVTRMGGLAGIRRGWLLETADVEAWEPLVDACPWERPGDDVAEPDRFIWRIEVRAPEPRRTAELPERAVSGPWRDLLDRVRIEGEPVKPQRRPTRAAEASDG